MVRWSLVLIAFTACKQEKPLGREIHIPLPEPVTARVVLGECARTLDMFVVGMAPPKPMYWVELAPPLDVGQWGTIGHGGGFGMRGGGGGWSSGPAIQIGQPSITGADETWKAITRRYIKRAATKLMYCYEKEQLQNREIAGTVNASLAVAKTGKVTATITSTFDAKVGACMRGVFDAIELPKPNAPFTAIIPVTLRLPGTSYVDPAVEARNATAIGAPNPLAQRIPELEACARTGHARGIVDLTFEQKGTSASVIGAPAGDATAECVKKVAATTTKTSEASVMRCAFAIGTSTDTIATAVMDADGRLTMNGQPLESMFTANYDNAVTVSGLETKGPVGLEIHPDVVMEKVYPVLDELHSRQSAYVFIVPHAFGGKRVLGRTLPMLPHPKDKTLANDALHVIRVDRGGLFLDDEPVMSLVQFSADLARIRREDGPAVQIRFERETTFGQFAGAIDLAVEAGLVDWEL